MDFDADDDAYFACAGDIDDYSLESTYGDQKWLLDSRCTTHLCQNNSKFVTLDQVSGNMKLASNDSTNVKGRGVVNLKVKTKLLAPHNIWYGKPSYLKHIRVLGQSVCLG